MKLNKIISFIWIFICMVFLISACNKSDIGKKEIKNTDIKDKNKKEVIVDDNRKNIKLSNLSKCKKGSYIDLGKYYNKPILWKCVSEDRNGKLLVSEDVVCQKAFDASESGDIDKGSKEEETGSNVWTNSNLREWLNSSNKIVKYTTEKPCKKAVMFNAYDKESGFLTNFSANEKSMINPVKHGEVEDKVFLLSQNEMKKYFNINDDSPIEGDIPNSSVKRLTNEAIKNSNYPHNYKNAKGKWYYWTRTPDTQVIGGVTCVEIDNCFDMGGNVANDGSTGVVPAMYIK